MFSFSCDPQKVLGYARKSYDAYGNQTKITDALGNVTLKYYDRLGSNTAIVSPKNYIKGAELADMAHTEFTYDALGRVLTQTEVYQKLTLKSDYEWAKEWAHITSKTFRYDTLGNIISTMDALGNVTTSTYNLAGLLDNTLEAQSKLMG